MKPLREQVMLLTGATDGIGKQTAHELARRGVHLLLHGRSAERGERVLEEVRRATGNDQLAYYQADLSSLAEVRHLAAAVAADHPRLDVLINNAGVLGGRDEPRTLSQDGHELRMAVNYLAPFLLTHLLLPCLRRAAPSRIVNVSSTAQQPIDFDDLMVERHFDTMQAYAQSKLALTMFSMDLAERVRDDGITVVSVHPGSLLDTKMVRQTFGSAWGSAQSGADALLHLVTSEAIPARTGGYFDQQHESRAHAQAYDVEARQRLWALSEHLTGLAG
jgi:NAD(P)-dependent dehydrogenase (short-subunit alcohol dehydrogenase family)